MSDAVGKMGRPSAASWCGDDHDYSIWTQMPPHRCKHKLMGIVPIVSVWVQGGYTSRCLICGAVGPIRGGTETARRALLEKGTRNEDPLTGRVGSP